MTIRVFSASLSFFALMACSQQQKVTSGAEVAPEVGGAEIAQPKPATDFTREKQRIARVEMPVGTEREQDFASRGFIAAWPDNTIRKIKGGVSVDFSNNDFIQGLAPDTANPLLWRHSELMGYEGLFEVTPGIYQVRGFDVSNITFVETENGYIVIDPLTAAEPAAAAYELVKAHVGDKPVVAIIYTHSHSDHFAGIEGVIDLQDVTNGDVMVIAPENFMEETAREWLIAGTAMGRRAFYQFGLFLPYGKKEHIGMGMGPRIALGEVTLVAPTYDITTTGETLNIDGTEVIFQLTPGAEAPVEMNFYFPKYKALCMAETATATIHNVQTLRGAQVRDAKEWADYLTEATELFGDKSDVLFVTHHWPRFGADHIREYLGKHRDAYKYLHDQTVRMMNRGMTPNEISENLTLPPSLGSEWYNRGFYGSLSHNSKAVYDKYMGWYNGIPSELNPHPPVERAKRYVKAVGGVDKLIGIARRAFDEGDYRWSAELLQHLVFANPKLKQGRELLADSYEQLGYQAESAVWRNIYLTSAKELRQGGADKYTGGSEDYLLGAATDEQIMDLLAVRLLPEKASGQALSMNLEFKETGNRFNMSVNNSVLLYRKSVLDAEAITLSVTRQGFLAVAFGFMSVEQAKSVGMVSFEGDAADFTSLASMLDNPTLDYNIIEP